MKAKLIPLSALIVGNGVPFFSQTQTGRLTETGLPETEKWIHEDKYKLGISVLVGVWCGSREIPPVRTLYGRICFLYHSERALDQ